MKFYIAFENQWADLPFWKMLTFFDLTYYHGNNHKSLDLIILGFGISLELITK